MLFKKFFKSFGIKVNVKILSILWLVTTTYSFAGNDWFIYVSNKANKPIQINLYPYYACFYGEDYVPQNIGANSDGTVYIEEKSSIACGAPVNKVITFSVNNDINQTMAFNAIYDADSSNSMRRIATNHATMNWLTFAGAMIFPYKTILSLNQTIKIYVIYENDGTITLAGYCSTDGPCTI